MAEKEMPHLPTDSERVAIVGATGTGKTQAALWHLSTRDFSGIPWMVYDFKGDDHIGKLENVQHVSTDFVPGPKEKGIFVVHPLPSETEEVEAQLWKLWERERVGIYVDEGFMVDNPAMDAILTQGRSKKVPVIYLTQRPVWCSRFVFSEASYYQIFRLNDKRDEKTIEHFTPINFAARLPLYHSYYYDVGRNQLFTFAPVPKESEILATIDAKLAALKPRKRWL